MIDDAVKDILEQFVQYLKGEYYDHECDCIVITNRNARFILDDFIEECI